MRELWQNAWARLLALVAGLVLVIWLARQLAEAVTPFLIAFALAYLLNPAANALERAFARPIEGTRLLRGWLRPRAVAVLAVVLLVVALVVLLFAVIVPLIYHQIADAIQKIPEYARTLRAKVEPLLERLNVQYPSQYEEVRARLEQQLKDRLPDLLSPVTHAIGRAFSSALGFALTLLNLVVIPVFAVFLLLDMNHIREGAKELVPVRFRPYAYSRVHEVDRVLSAFARGQITVCLILGSFYAISLTALGVPMGLPVGFLIGFFNLVPFMSYVLGLPLALLLSWLDAQDATRLLVVAAVFSVGQFVEGNFITPRIVGRSVGLHDLVVMLAVLVGGTLFGFVGMLVAVPTTAALSVFLRDLRDLYLESEFYKGA